MASLGFWILDHAVMQTKHTLNSFQSPSVTTMVHNDLSKACIREKKISFHKLQKHSINPSLVERMKSTEQLIYRIYQ
jgi:hypothetical protein